MIAGHITAMQVRYEYIRTKQCQGRSITGNGNSLILLLRTFRYRSNVHSEKRAGNEEILL